MARATFACGAPAFHDVRRNTMLCHDFTNVLNTDLDREKQVLVDEKSSGGVIAAMKGKRSTNYFHTGGTTAAR